MGKRGPAPKPTALKILEGNKGKRPLNKKEVKPESAGVLKPPAYLKGIARATWLAITPELDKLGLLARIDTMALVGLCVAYEDAIESKKTIDRQGRTIKTHTGAIKPHPAVAQSRSAWQQVRNFCSEFGLTPSARSRIQLEVPREDGETDEQDAYYFGS